MKDMFKRTAQWRRMAVPYVLAAMLLGACGETQAPVDDEVDEVCQPACEGKVCGGDGCGGSCGACAADETCTVEGICAASSDPGCDETCADLGLECGTHCGESCGTCTGSQEICVDGACVCSPDCTAALCEQPDGCGEPCGPCPSAESCAGCPLRLSVVDQVEQDGLLTEVTLALDYDAPPEKPLPGMADIRLAVSGPVVLQSVGLGPPVMDAEKDLYVDPETGKPFSVLSDGTHQVLVFSTANTDRVGAGRWLLFRFLFKPPADAGGLPWYTEPAVFRLLDRDGIFAPPPADAVLWTLEFDGPVVVWPEVAP